MKSVIKRRWRINFLLFLLFCALLCIVLFQDRWQGGHTERLLKVDLSTITQVAIERYPDSLQAEQLFLKREMDDWYIHGEHSAEQPIQVNSLRMRQLLTLLQEPVIRQYAVEDLDLARYVLNPGYVRLTFDYRQASKIKQERLLLGMSHPVSGLRYVLHDTQVKLVNEAVFALLMDEQAFR